MIHSNDENVGRREREAERKKWGQAGRHVCFVSSCQKYAFCLFLRVFMRQNDQKGREKSGFFSFYGCLTWKKPSKKRRYCNFANVKQNAPIVRSMRGVFRSCFTLLFFEGCKGEAFCLRETFFISKTLYEKKNLFGCKPLFHGRSDRL